MPTYRLLSGSHARFEGVTNVRYARGEAMELSEEEAERLGERLEMVSDSVVGDYNIEESGEVGADSSDVRDISTMSWRDAVEYVKGITSLSVLEKVAATENGSPYKPRVSVTDALAAKRLSLERK